jgi:iron complex outermembrane recepter protein
LRSYKIGVIHQQVDHLRFYWVGSFIAGQSHLTSRISYQKSDRAEFGHPENAEIPALSLSLHTITYDLKWHLPDLGKWDFITGVNGMYQLNFNKGATEFLIPDFRLFDIGAFAFTNVSHRKFDFAFGLRYDFRQFESKSLYTGVDAITGFDIQMPYSPTDSSLTKQFESVSEFFSGLSASFGMTWNANDKSGFKLNMAQGYRAPSVTEITARGVHPGSGFMQIGSSELKPEFALQADAGFFMNREHVSINLTAFANRIQNYTYNEKLVSVTGSDSIFIDGANEFPVYQFRQTPAVLVGGEFSFDIHPHPLDWLHIENSLALVFAENKGAVSDDTRYLPLIPPFHSTTEFRAELPQTMGRFSSIYFSFAIQFYAAQNRIYSAYGTETKTPDYTLLNAVCGTDILNRKGKSILTFQLACSNMLDRTYQSHLSRLKYMDSYPVNGTGRTGIYNMGRNFSAKLIFTFPQFKYK